jgi:hypothetical protein
LNKATNLTKKADIERLNLTQQPHEHETVDKGHGRVDKQSIWTSTILNDYFNFPNKGHVCCIQRHIFDYKKKSCRCETVYGITALTPLKQTLNVY